MFWGGTVDKKFHACSPQVGYVMVVYMVGIRIIQQTGWSWLLSGYIQIESLCHI
jgi:hypothetical protein